MTKKLLRGGIFVLPFFLCLLRQSVVFANDFAVAAYFPDYRKGMNINATTPFLTDLILFSLDPREDGGLDGVCCLGSDHYQVARGARAYKKETSGESLRLWVSVGGFGRSKNFGTISSNPELLRKLTMNLLDLCEKEGLDGVDFDWEGIKNQEEFKNYLKLIWFASKAFHLQGRLVSVALHKGMTMPPQVNEAVDRINLMSYDLITTDASYHASHPKVIAMVEQYFSDKGPASKTLMGIPFYARGRRNYQVAETLEQIVEKNGNDFKLLLETDTFGDMKWESQLSFQIKVEFAVQNGMLGIFFWEIGQDYQIPDVAPGGLLLERAHKAVVQYTSESRTEL